MQYRIKITNLFYVPVIGKTSRAVFPTDKPCDAVVIKNEIVQVDYPPVSFVLPYDKFRKYLEEGNISIC